MPAVRSDHRTDVIDDYGVSPTAARWRARALLFVVMVVFFGLTVGVGFLVKHHPNLRGLYVVALFAGLIPVMAPLLCQEWGPASTHRGRFDTVLTARTLSGYRSVNLSHIRRIRFVYLPGVAQGNYVPALDLIIVTDVRGVRVGIKDPDTRLVLKDILARTRNTAAPAIRISRGAQAELGLTAPTPTWRWTLFRVFGTLMLATAWALAVMAGSVAISLS